MDEIGKDEILKLKRKKLKSRLLGLQLSLSEEEQNILKECESEHPTELKTNSVSSIEKHHEEMKEHDEFLNKKREELKVRLLKLREESLAPIPDDGVWLEDIIRKEEKERIEYIEKNYEFIEQKILSRTPTPFSIKFHRLGYYPLYESLDIILYIHDKLLENHSESIYSKFKVDGALLYLVTDDSFYHITLFFYNDDKANLFYKDRWLSKFECHPSNCASITTINFDKKEMGNARYYLYSVLERIFHISPFQHIETTFKIGKIK